MNTIRIPAFLLLPLILGVSVLAANEGHKPSDLAEEIRALAREIAAGARAEAARARAEAQASAEEARAQAFTWVQSAAAAAAAPQPFLGVITEPLPTVLRDYIDIPANEGLLLKKALDDGPAVQAGIEDNDILLRVGETPVNSPAGLSAALRKEGVGQEVKLTVLRRGERLEKTVTLGSRPASSGRWESIVGELGTTGSRIVEAVQEWIPGSVRVIVDENERISVDLSELRGNLDDMRLKLEEMRRTTEEGTTPPTPPTPPVPPTTERRSAEGTRTTIVHMEKTVLTHSGPDGTATLSGSGSERRIRVTSTDGVELFDGPLPGNSVAHLPEAARPLARTLLDSLARLQMPEQNGEIEVEMDVNARPEH